MPIEWQTVPISFTGGLAQRGDQRAQQPPALDVATAIQFEEVGGIQTRKPLQSIGSNNILGGGTLTNVRSIQPNGDENLCFTDTQLYSWSARDSLWVLKGTHLAIAHDEQTRFGANDDQFNCDRA